MWERSTETWARTSLGTASPPQPGEADVNTLSICLLVICPKKTISCSGKLWYYWNTLDSVSPCPSRQKRSQWGLILKFLRSPVFPHHWLTGKTTEGALLSLLSECYYDTIIDSSFTDEETKVQWGSTTFSKPQHPISSGDRPRFQGHPDSQSSREWGLHTELVWSTQEQVCPT